MDRLPDARGSVRRPSHEHERIVGVLQSAIDDHVVIGEELSDRSASSR